MTECIACKAKTEYQKFLSCGSSDSRHRLCQACIEKLAKPATKGVWNGIEVECPICRTSTMLPDGDVSKLETKFFVDLICEDCSELKQIKDQWWCKTCEKTICGTCAMSRHRQHDCCQWEKYSVPKEVVHFFKNKLDNEEVVQECQRKIKNFCQRLESTLLTRYIIETSNERKLYSNLLNSVEMCFGKLKPGKELIKEDTMKNFDKKLKIVETVMKSSHLSAGFDSNDILERINKNKDASMNFPSLTEVLMLFDKSRLLPVSPTEKSVGPISFKLKQSASFSTKTALDTKVAVTMRAFVGKFKLTESKNFDEYMRALGVDAVSRTLANKAIPVVEFIITNNETWTMKTINAIKNSEINFKLGEEFDETSLDGRKCRTTFNYLLNGKLCQRQKATKPGEKDTWIEREIKGDDLITTMPLGGITCVRIFKRL